MTAPLTLDREYAAVLFDMDGTLLDSRLIVERIWRRWSAIHGVDADKILSGSHGRRSIDVVREFATPGMDCEAEAHKIDTDEEADLHDIVAVPGANELLRSLPKDRWAIVTSAGLTLTKRRLAAAGLPLPETLVTAEDVSLGKPNPQGYQLAARLLGKPVESCLVFEDAPAGIEAGLRAGCDVVAISFARPHPFQADCPTVRDYTQIRFSLTD